MSHKARQRTADRKQAKQRKKVQNIGKPADGCWSVAVPAAAIGVTAVVALWRKR